MSGGDRLDRLLCRIALALYPRAFRREYGDDVLAGLWRRRAELYRERPRRLRLLGVLLRDLAFAVPRAWWTHGFARPLSPLVPRSALSMDSLSTDVRHAFRRVIRRPATAALAVLALGLGIGLTTATFSIVDGVMLKGLPFEEPQELMLISRIIPAQGPARLFGRLHDYRDLAERQTTFERLAAISQAAMNVSAPGQDPEFVPAARLTTGLLPMLGVEPALGRAFTDEDAVPGAPPVVLVGHRFWQDRLGGDAAVVGSSLRIDGQDTTVIGVMPADFGFPVNQELWGPLQIDYGATPRDGGVFVFIVGRLRDDASVLQAQGDLQRIMAQLAQEHPDSNEGMTVVVNAYVREVIGYQLPPFLYTMLGAVALVLVIACANVANLLLARASRRTRDMAICSALGASRWGVFRQILAEAAIIAVLGSGVGLLLARLAVGQFNGVLARLPQGVPFWFAVALDPRALGVVLLLTVAATLLAGMLPALKASGADASEILKDSSRGSSSLRIGRLSRGLVLVEVALSCALLVAAGLMVRSILNLSREDHPFEEEGLLTAQVSLPPADYPDAESWRQLFGELGERLAAIPGATAAAIGSDLPVVGFANGRFSVEGQSYPRESDHPSTRIASVNASYFETLRAPVLQGRTFTAADVEDARPVAVVNRYFADRFLPGGSPLGRRVAIRQAVELGTSLRDDERWYTIVGVVPDMYIAAQAFILEPAALYVPFAQRPSSAANLIVRSDGDPTALVADVRAALGTIDRDLAIAQVDTLAHGIAATIAVVGVLGAMFAIFGAAALFLAAVGLYGVLAFSVAQRTGEMGVRVALGAAPAHVRRMVLRQGLGQVAVGLAIGLVLAVGLGSLLTFLLYDVSPRDPVVLGGIAVVLLGAGLLACWVPARRATRIDPLAAMRGE